MGSGVGPCEAVHGLCAAPGIISSAASADERGPRVAGRRAARGRVLAEAGEDGPLLAEHLAREREVGVVDEFREAEEAAQLDRAAAERRELLGRHELLERRRRGGGGGGGFGGLARGLP